MFAPLGFWVPLMAILLEAGVVSAFDQAVSPKRSEVRPRPAPHSMSTVFAAGALCLWFLYNGVTFISSHATRVDPQFAAAAHVAPLKEWGVLMIVVGVLVPFALTDSQRWRVGFLGEVVGLFITTFLAYTATIEAIEHGPGLFVAGSAGTFSVLLFGAIITTWRRHSVARVKIGVGPRETI